MLSLGKAGAGTRILDRRQLAVSYCRPVFLGVQTPAFSSAYKYYSLLHLDPRSLTPTGKGRPSRLTGPASSPYISFVGFVGEADLDDETGDAGYPEARNMKPHVIQGKKHRRATTPEQKQTTPRPPPAICICPTRRRPVVASVIPLVL